MRPRRAEEVGHDRDLVDRGPPDQRAPSVCLNPTPHELPRRQQKINKD